MFKKKYQNKDAAIIEVECYESVGVCIATENREKAKWVLDLGCAFHMYSFKNFFTRYHEFYKGKVIMGSNAMCKVIRIRNISLKLHNSTIRELKQVGFMPDLKRNLIFLGILDQMGCSVKVESSEMKVLKGSKVIMMCSF